MKIQWEDRYNTGNEQLDEQHRIWVDFYNRLDAAMMEKSWQDLQETKSDILKKMAEYVDCHFRYEEDFMRSIGYPDSDKHWRMHKNFRDKIYRICRDQQEGKLVLNREVMDLIKSWLLNHIIEHDMRVAAYHSQQLKGDSSS